MTDFCTSPMKNTSRFPALSKTHAGQNSRILHLKIDSAPNVRKQEGQIGRREDGETRSKRRSCFTPPLPLSPPPTLLTLVLALFLSCAHAPAAGSKVTFNDE